MNAPTSELESLPSQLGDILVVDDEPRNLQLLGNLLFQVGYSITLAGNGAQALDAARNAPPDLILMDVMMPAMDGFEVTRRLKQEEGLQEVPVIFLTAKSDSDDVRAGFQAGGVDYVLKPFQAEELLLRIRTHLDLKRTREGLARANEELRRANETQAQFISMIAHDLRNPFHALRMFPEFVISYLDTDRELIDRLAHEAVREIDRVGSFFEEMMEWALMQMNVLQAQLERVVLGPLLCEVCGQSKAQAERKDITLNLETPPDLAVNADPKMLATVVRNLVSNSIKFTHRGGTVTVKAAAIEDGKVLVEVADTGVGIPPEVREKLFSLDLRVTLPGTEREKGSGLGLILCQQFLARHGTEFRISSEQGQGSTFGFVLPVA